MIDDSGENEVKRESKILKKNKIKRLKFNFKIDEIKRKNK